MHFIGVLFGGDRDLLEEYYEGLEVAPYVRYTKEEIIKHYIDNRKLGIKLRKEKIKSNPSISTKYQQWLDEHPKYNKKTAWEAIKKDFKDELDEDGNVITTFNPRGKWDWYITGGRWSEYFPLKWKDENGNTIYRDEATIEEVDWKKYKETREAPYCYISADGSWEEKGTIGRFMSSNEKTSDVWQDTFFKELRKYPKDTIVTAIDFHV